MLTLCHNKRVTLIEFEANWPRIAHVKESEIVIAGIFFFFFWGSTVSENKAFFFSLRLPWLQTWEIFFVCHYKQLPETQNGSQTETRLEWKKASKITDETWHIKRSIRMFSPINEKFICLWFILTETHFSSDWISNETDSALQCPPMARSIFV